ncbi:MAG: hypothetical protein ACYDAE_11970 [Steroidobacteraceae bacterium]
MSLLKNLAGVPKRWREVGPLTYREVGGQTDLKFVTDSDGQVAYWISDDFLPVMISVLTIAYIVGLLALLGALAVLAEAVRRVLRGPGGWLVRTGEALLGLCAIYGVWAIHFFGFANFSYRW